MVPIEWVTRRLATGSFIKINPEVSEGYRFAPPKQETCFKDDSSHDPLWCDEQIPSSNFECNGLIIGADEVQIMRHTSLVVFEVLERAWKTRNCALVDMKVEFGVDEDGNILLADIIDSDTWRIWPAGDKRLMVDKTVCINLDTVTDSDLNTVKRSYSWVIEQLSSIVPPQDHLVVILVSSEMDVAHGEQIATSLELLGMEVMLQVCSVLKNPEKALQIVRTFEAVIDNLVFVTVDERLNSLVNVISANTRFPVINYTPLHSDKIDTKLRSIRHSPKLS